MQKTLPSIRQVQQAIIEEFALLQDQPDLMLDYIIDLGVQMPPLGEAAKVYENLVPGCLAKVWLTQQEKQGRLWLRAESNAAITKGLISLLVRVFSGQRIEDIVQAEFFLDKAIGIGKLIGAQRRSGFANMLHRIKQYAAAAMGKV